MRKKGTRYWKQKKSEVSVIAWLSSTVIFELLEMPRLGGRNSYKAPRTTKPSEKDPSRAEGNFLTKIYLCLERPLPRLSKSLNANLPPRSLSKPPGSSLPPLNSCSTLPVPLLALSPDRWLCLSRLPHKPRLAASGSEVILCILP